MKSFGQIDSSRIKMHLPKLRSDSFQKFATASQTLGFEKAVIAPWLLSLSWFMPYNKIMNGEIHVFNRGGSARSGQKSLIQNKQNQNYTL